MEDVTFLDYFGGGQGDSSATLKAVDCDGRVCHVSDRINPLQLLDKCPLLYHAFEDGFQGRLQASIEAPSRAAVIALLRYCYTGSYLPADTDNVPNLLLLHAHVYKVAEDFDVPELQLLAHGNFSIQIDCACSLPTSPQDLLQTIRFVYAHFASPQARQQQGLINTLLNYCIAVYQYHKLGESASFLDIVLQIPEFRQDLCRTNMERNFQDECAFDIIGLAIDTLQPQPGILPTTLASRDLPDVMLYDRPSTPQPASEATPGVVCKTEELPMYKSENYPACNSENTLVDSFIGTAETANEPAPPSSSEYPSQSTLVHRPKSSATSLDYILDSASEDEGFAIVRRPKPTPEEEPMSSPEIIPSNTVDVSAATGSNYPDDDDEWIMI